MDQIPMTVMKSLILGPLRIIVAIPIFILKLSLLKILLSLLSIIHLAI